MQTLTLDFETHIADGYTLTRLTIEEYVRDSRFEALCLAVKPYGQQGFVLKGEGIAPWIASQDWGAICVIMHHAQFDGFILSERYGVHPAFCFDTLSMARAVHGPLERVSLEELAKRYDLPAKTVPYGRLRGHRWQEMDDELRAELVAGALNDAEITEALFRKLVGGFPKSELEVINLTLAMYTVPRLRGDAELFARLSEHERTEKDALLQEIGLKEADLQSSATLLRILESYGETEIPRKKTSAGSVPQFAAGDDYMLENSGRDDVVGKILQARLAVKSTIEETRANRLAAMARRGNLPVYHKYFGAVTGRWAGGERTNIQNLPKGGQLRAGLMAPEGQSFVIVDFSQIEYRILCALAGQHDKLEALADKNRDLYCEFGTGLFGRPISKDDKQERNLAKTVVLGSGYGQGKEKCAATARAKRFDFPRATTDKAIDLYRTEHPYVTGFWRRCDQTLIAIERGQQCHLEGTPIKFEDHCLLLPNGLKCRFDLVWGEEGLYRRTSRCNGEPASFTSEAMRAAGYTRYWGGGLVEFCCQSLARIRLSELMLAAKKRHGLTPVFLVHDEFVSLASDSEAESMLSSLLEIASEPSEWWPDGPPFAAEGRIAKRYGKG